MLHQGLISQFFYTYTFTFAFDTFVHLVLENYFWDLHTFNIRYFYLTSILMGVILLQSKLYFNMIFYFILFF